MNDHFERIPSQTKKSTHGGLLLQNLDSKQRVLLGFDYGTRRIGIAVGQEISGTANTLTTLTNINGKPDWATITRLIKEWQPDLLVVGLPLHLDGNQHENTLTARRFGRQLNGRYNLPVEMMDERLTSVEATDHIQNTDLSHNLKQNKGTIDKVAAQLILQSWLDQQRQKMD